jgi:hypothetical protein
MIKVLVFAALLTTSCAHTRDYNGYPAPQSQADCRRLFSDIHEVQAVRHDLMDKMSRTTRAYKQDKMTKARFHRKRETWLARENQLRADVTFLYDIGYEYGCF